ncbi:MAG: OmpA family protein [Gammaproteobacteria bacterium]
MNGARNHSWPSHGQRAGATLQHVARTVLRALIPGRRLQPATPTLFSPGDGILRLVCLLGLLWLGGTAQAQSLPGTAIENTASLDYGLNAERQSVGSNPVRLVVRPLRSDATLDLIKIAPGGEQMLPIATTSCGAQQLPPATLLDGTVLPANGAQAVTSGSAYHANEPVFVRVQDTDQNLDGLVAEIIEIRVTSDAGDRETLNLTETGPNTGVFTGYLPTSSQAVATNDCVLQLVQGDRFSVTYRDPQDTVDVSEAAALVDPLGVVFDSTTGAAIDGALVTLINTATNQPADVFGDDGVSSYPATLTSGGRVTDSGGTIYQFAEGRFRFPLIAPGTYRLDVVPPDGYTAPSQISPAVLQTLPGAPFALLPASFGDVLNVLPGPVINVDIPLDPGRVELFLQKTTPVVSASPGDFVEYTLTLDNTSNVSSGGELQVQDVLPSGFRLVSGSVRLGDANAADPEFGNSARELNFVLPALASGARHVLRYVTEVTSMAAGEEATNVASARSVSGLTSNAASARIRLVDDLFADRAFLVGRVVNSDCGARASEAATGVPNVRIYLEDGRYAVTDETGRYHFEGLRPGAHVVQLDTDTVPRPMELVPCTTHGFFAGRAYSQFVDLAAGALWRADFYLRDIPPPTGAVELRLIAAPHDAADEARYVIEVSGSGVPVSDLALRLMLPMGVDYRAQTLTIDGRAVRNPRIADQTLSISLGERIGQWQQRIEFDASIAPDVVGELTAKAVVTFDTPARSRQRTPLADASFIREAPHSERIERTFTPRFDSRDTTLAVSDQEHIARAMAPFRAARDVHVAVTGHTDNVQIAAHNRHEFENNQALSEARARRIAQLVGEALGLPPSRVSYRGMADREPIADNSSAAGRARNRRVEVHLFGERSTGVATLSPVKLDSGVQQVSTQGISAHDVAATKTALVTEPSVDWFVDNAWLEDAAPTLELLTPSRDANPAIGSVKIVVRHPGAERVVLMLNNAPVSALNFDGVTRNKARTVAASRWRGVDIKPGANTLEVVTLDKNDQQTATLSRTVHFAGGPVRGVLNGAASTLIADGRTMPKVVLDLFDRDGMRARPDSVGVYTVDPPYRSQWQVNAERDNALIVVGDRDPVYTVDGQGRAVIELEPTAQAGEVVLRLRFENGREEDVRAWLKPAARDWILVGLAEGTAGLNSLSDNELEAVAAGIDDHYYQDGRVAFFAKGRVRGEHLLTLAYDSDGDEADARERLFGQIDPDRFYTLYGDATDQRFDAPSAEKLFVRLERDQYYAMFGDYETGLNVTELSRYNRSFNGVKAEYRGKRFAALAFGTRTDQAFIKDELRGDGTSGLYRLTRQPILINSEKITLETRDRFRSERVIYSQPLTRHLDYDIDYLNGTLFFKQPVPTRDRDLNPVYIVADYESRDGRDRALTAGGRVSFKFGQRVALGATALREGVVGGQGELYGADLDVQLSDVTRLRAEIATSNSRQSGRSAKGDAYLVSLQHQGKRLDGQVYAQRQDALFGLGQQRATESGTRKVGADGRLRLSKTMTLNAELFRQRGLQTGVVRDVAQAELRYQAGRASVAGGMRYADDRGGDLNESRTSRQAFVNGSLNVLGDKVVLRASHDVELDDASQNVDYPARTTLGADLKIHDKAALYVEHEIARGGSVDADTTRMGVRATPWERARINAAVNRDIREYGPRVFANVGLVQGFSLGERWTVDVGVDHTNTIAGDDLTRVNENAPLASGNDTQDFTSAFVGALYRSDDWSATSRLEHRRSDAETRDGLFFGLYREERAGVGFSADAEIFDVVRQSGADAFDAQLRLGWAWRPDESRWTLFNRLDAVYQDVDAAAQVSAQTTWKLINNMSANYTTQRGTQWSLRYGAKYVQTAVADATYTGFSDLMGVQWRRQFSERFDLGLHGNIRHAWRSSVVDYSLGLELGASLATNTWIGLGYNVAGFEDNDFSRSGYLARGPYVRFRIKADQDSLATLRRRMPFVSREPHQSTQ